MDLINYPETNYNSWLDEEEANEYFESRLKADSWDVCTAPEAALMTAFRSLAELNLDIVFDADKKISEPFYTATEATDILEDLQQAQCEQALHELMNDLDSPPFESVNLGDMISAKISDKFAKPSRFSERTLSILRPYTITRTLTRTR